MKRWSVIASWSAAVMLSACASAPQQDASLPPPGLFQDNAFAAPTARVSAAEALALSPQMKRYVEVDIAPQIRRLGAQQGLVDALYKQAQLRLDYESDITRTAAEAFDARAGNCLSLVLMTAALATELRLPLTYQALIGEEVWAREGDLSLAIGHVNIVVAKRLIDRVQGVTGDTQLELSFGSSLIGRGSQLRPISERTLLSMFMNNRAAEWLSRGDLANAYAHAREAVMQDSRFAGAYNTLGVIYQRRGIAAPAEQAFSVALALDAKNRPALSNLAKLLDELRRPAEAATVRMRLAKLEAEPPFMHFDLGRAAALSGDYRSAREHLLRELKRDPDYHEFHYWLAVALAGLGDAAGAQEQLRLADKTSISKRDHALYAAKLERLQSAQRSN